MYEMDGFGQTLSHVTKELEQKKYAKKYNYENHQEGIAGSLSIRLIEGRNLHNYASQNWRWWNKTSVNPYAVFSSGLHQAKSSTVKNNNNPTWRKEIIELPISKIDFEQIRNTSSSKIEYTNVRTELCIDVFSEEGFSKKASDIIGFSTETILGTAYVDFTDLVEGNLEILDKWITLVPPTLVSKSKNHELSPSELRILLQYEPKGLEPMVGDLVKIEGFGEYPSACLPSIHSLLLQVKAICGNYILCTYTTKHGIEANVRLHRYCVYVVRRESLLGNLYRMFLVIPITYIGTTSIGKKIWEHAKPYTNFAVSLAVPVALAARASVQTTLRASFAALSALFHE